MSVFSTTQPRYGQRAIFGFTLIEVLVVVAIIALLIAILLPSLSRVRELARVTACAANMRTSGMAVVYYAQKYQDYFPLDRYWAEMSRPLMQKLKTRRDKLDQSAINNGLDQAVEFYICPSDPIRARTNMPQIHVDGITKVVDVNYRVSFGMNGFLTQQLANSAGVRHGTNYNVDNNRPRKTAEVKRASDVVMLAESGNDNLFKKEQLEWDYDVREDSSGPRIEVHHKTGNTFLYADTHTSYIKVIKGSTIPQCGVPRFPWHWVPLKRLPN
ncbi:MAG: prepilin-type N-terminal cleavage/methylation domain-containing protein [Planctomycetota bacterium]|jgi:prepilin-type N-terminal cleavage/methylation domain-containing protein